MRSRGTAVWVYFYTSLICTGRGSVTLLPLTMASCWEPGKGKGRAGNFSELKASNFPLLGHPDAVWKYCNG